jgi:hypothetical protein
MDASSLLLVVLAIALNGLTIVLCLRRAEADGQSALMWGLLAVFIWPVALLGLLVTKPVPAESSPVADPPAALPTPQPQVLAQLEEEAAYPADSETGGMSVYTPFILNGAGLLILVGLARSAGDTLGALFTVMLLLLAANTALLLKAFFRREIGLAICYFLALSAGSVLLLWVASSFGHR